MSNEYLTKDLVKLVGMECTASEDLIGELFRLTEKVRHGKVLTDHQHDRRNLIKKELKFRTKQNLL